MSEYPSLVSKLSTIIFTLHAQCERGKVIGCGVHTSESTVVLSM